MAEFTTASEFPNEYSGYYSKYKYENKETLAKLKMQFMRDRVAGDLKEFRKCYHNDNSVRFAEIDKRIRGYFAVGLMSYDAFRRACTMAYKKGLRVI